MILLVLKQTGICLVPGSAFIQQPGTYHFRINCLVQPNDFLEEKMQVLQEFNNWFHKYYMWPFLYGPTIRSLFIIYKFYFLYLFDLNQD
jgi:hypothetical protein